MILEKLQKVNSTLLDSVNATSNKHAAETFSIQLGMLNNSTTQLEQLLNLMEAMYEKGITSRIVTAEIKQALQSAVDSCGEKVNDHSLDSGTVTALKHAVDLCKGAVASIWKEVADKQCTPIIESLSSLKGLLANKTAAETLIDSLHKSKDNTPTSVSSLDTYLSNIEKGKKIIEEMHFDSDPEVKAFSGKVQAQRATVSSLTPHILEWLKDNNLTDKIRLRF